MKFVYNSKFTDTDKIEKAKDIVSRFWSDFDDFIAIWWWDWAFLHHLNLESEALYFFPIWLWTRNFLMNPLSEISTFCFSDFEEIKMSLLEVRLFDKSWNVFHDFAFNDVYMNVEPWRMGSLTVSWCFFPERDVNWDWIIICTPQWSTWYNRNAWWVTLPLWYNVIWITENNSMNKSSMVVWDQNIHITPKRWNFICFIDSRKYENIDRVDILWYKKEITVLYLKSLNFAKNRYL